MPQISQNKTNIFNSKKFKKLSQNVAASFINEAIINLNIDPRGKSEKELNLEILKYFKPLITAKEAKYYKIVDHRISILREGRKYLNLNNNEFACLFYAIWFEHWINSVIVVYGSRNNLSSDDTIQIIRESSIKAKFSWLLKLLRVPNISLAHKTLVFRLFEFRNAYVHYKFKGYELDKDNRQNKELVIILSEIEKTVKYFTQFENKYIYLNSKKKIKNIVKKKPYQRLDPTVK